MKEIIKNLFKTSCPGRVVDGGGTQMGNAGKKLFLPLLIALMFLALAGIGYATLTTNISAGSTLSGIVNVGASSDALYNLTNCTYYIWTTASGVRQNITSTNTWKFSTLVTGISTANETILNTTLYGGTGLEEASKYNIKVVCNNESGATATETAATITDLIVNNKKPGYTANLYYPISGTTYTEVNDTVVLRAKVNDSGSHVTSCTFLFNSSAGITLSKETVADSSGDCSVTFYNVPNKETFYWYVELSDGTDTTTGLNSSYFTTNLKQSLPGKSFVWLQLQKGKEVVSDDGGITVKTNGLKDIFKNKGFWIFVAILFVIIILDPKKRKKLGF